MANTTNQAHIQQFESYFNRADLDRDGRISGSEAVSFFLGSGLPKPVLAQIWNFADQNRAGFLGRQEFFNALKLVTVAQSKRELTPDIVKAALYGPASSKIPPPQINLPQAPAAQPQPMATSPGMQMGAMTPTTSQNPGYRGPVPPNPNMNQQYFPSPGNQYPQPSQAYPSNMGPRGTQTTPGLPQSSIPSPASIPGRPSSGMLTPGFSGSMPTSGVQSSGMPTPGLPSSGMPSAGPPSSGMPSAGLSSSGMPTPGPPSFGMPTPSLPSSGMPTPGRPSSGIPTTGLPNSSVSTSGLPNSSVSTDLLGRRTSGAPSVASSLVPNRGANPSTPASGNSFSSNSTIGGDPFAAFQTISKLSASSPAASSAIVPVSASPPTSSAPRSSALVPASSAAQPSNSLDSLQSPSVKQPLDGQHQQAQTFTGLSQPVHPVTSAGASGISVGAGNSASDQSQPPWPKMTAASIQKYSKVFMEVDTDRDGKITGEQARNLFLSWRLPREVLKQVWDLADQDSDSMLSLREFCVALYLMERYREGRSLPASLPNSVMLDETLMRITGLPNSSHGNAAWGASSATGFRSVQGVPASQGVARAAALTPGMQSVPRADGTMRSQQPKSSPLLLDESQSNSLDDGSQKSQQPSPTESTDTEKKVEKVVLDSREKLEFYRTKMQELVMYKSRCDNRLNEIIERASADKREAESLGKKYEEKYKQVAEIASKLTIEEAKFREYQERKMELQQAIVNMEQGGSADGILQVRADRIQSDFEELLKALSERCKKHGIEIKSAALIELPKGWQPGIQEGATVWDEEWDKFEDEGLIFDKEINVDAQNAKGSPKSTLFQNGTHLHEDGFSPDSPSNTDVKSEKHFSRGGRSFDGESGYAHSEDGSTRSPHGSPAHRATPESPSRFSDVFAKSEADTDFHRSFDDHGWGTFDGTDDVDSVWGFNSKDERHSDSLFEPSGFSSSPRTDSPHKDNMYNRNNSPFTFADSVPGTPLSKSVNSPRYSEAGDNLFDNYSRFDSFSMSDSRRFSPPNETVARFDSMSSSRSGFGHSRSFTSFDDADPFGASGPFKVSSEPPKKGSDNWSSF